MRPPYPGEDHRLWEPGDAIDIPEDPDGRRILVVEDDAPIREVLVTTLRLSGYRVASVGEGLEAENVALSFGPELVLMDLMLPDMDGWEITRRIHAHRELGNPPVIVLSARVREIDRQRAFEAGAVHFLPKPCRATDLLEAVRAFMPEREGDEDDRSGLISIDEDELAPDGSTDPEIDTDAMRAIEIEIEE